MLYLCICVSPMNSPQIVNLTLSYVRPNQLVGFFITHNVSFDLVFKYDARGGTDDDLCKIYEFFPNVSIIGVTISNHMLNTSIGSGHGHQKEHKIQHIELIIDQNSTYILLVSEINIGFNIRVGCEIQYLNLTELKSLCIISKHNTSGLPICHVLDWLSSKCKTIRTMEFRNIYFNDKCAELISKHINLKNLKINANYMTNGAKLKCVNLRSFVWLSSMGWIGGEDLTFLECPKLTRLEISTCRMQNVYVPTSPNIRTIVLRSCDSFQNVEPIAKYKKLKHISFIVCSEIRDIGSLRVLMNLRTIYMAWCWRSIDTKMFGPRVQITRYKWV